MIKDKLLRLNTFFQMCPVQDVCRILLWKMSARRLRLLQEVSFRVKQLERQSVLARLGTQDIGNCINSFIGQYHLPPKKLADDSIIVDLGCNAGYTIVHFAHLYKNARIIGLEMDKNNFQLAQKNTNNLTRCSLLNKAVSTSKGVVYYIHKGSTSAYHILNHNEQQLVGDTVEVESITIEDVINQYKLDCIDYLKMDIEGTEISIFDENIADLSWLKKVGMLNIEVHGSRKDLNQIMKTLKKYSFTCWQDKKHFSCVMAIAK